MSIHFKEFDVLTFHFLRTRFITCPITKVRIPISLQRREGSKMDKKIQNAK